MRRPLSTSGSLPGCVFLGRYIHFTTNDEVWCPLQYWFCVMLANVHNYAHNYKRKFHSYLLWVWEWSCCEFFMDMQRYFASINPPTLSLIILLAGMGEHLFWCQERHIPAAWERYGEAVVGQWSTYSAVDGTSGWLPLSLLFHACMIVCMQIRFCYCSQK